jgi:hypothetical protein
LIAQRDGHKLAMFTSQSKVNKDFFANMCCATRVKLNDFEMRTEYVVCAALTVSAA